MFCEECGKQIPDNSKFCDGCGAPVKSVEGTAPPHGQPARREETKTRPFRESYENRGDGPSYGYGSSYENTAYRTGEGPGYGRLQEDRYPPEREKKKGGTQTVLIVVLGVVAAALIIVLVVLGIRTFGGKGGRDGERIAANKTEGTEEPLDEETEEATQEETTATETVPPAAETPAPTAAAVPETTVPPATETVSEYILPTSNSAYLTEADLAPLTREQLRLARNEIYARHGRKFKDAALNEYFLGKSWYVPTIEPDRFNESVFNDYETANRKLIADYEKKMGY